MSNILTSLVYTAQSLDAQHTGLDVVGQNIANVNTPGFSRRTIDLVAMPPYEVHSAGSGVDVLGVRAMRDQLVERRLRQETTAEQREAAIAGALGTVETALGEAGSSVDVALSNFFDSFATLAEDPTSPVARGQVQLQGDTLAQVFRSVSGRLDVASRDANVQVGSAVDDINSLVDRIASLNRTIATSTPEGTLHARDEQALLVKQLSGLVDVSVIGREDGGVDISVGNGRPLVVGVSGFQLEKDANGPAGNYAVMSQGVDITSEITGGKLGGLLNVRDVKIPDYMARLDELAYQVATRVNTVHAAGYDLNGAAGGAFFSFSPALSGTPAASSGAAAALRLDPGVAGDTSLIAAGGIAEAGDNQNARTMAALRDARVLNNNTATLSDGWAQLVYRVGRDTSTAKSEQANREEIVHQVDALRDQVSGVSLDEEAALMLKFQRAYEANARFFRVVDQMLDVLMSTVQ